MSTVSLIGFIVSICMAPIAAAVLTIIDKRFPSFRKNYVRYQIIVGVVFGLIAICGTEFGIPYEGAIINVRDAAPACASLVFGAPAGIIAGLIGGIERWFAVYWGAGQFTRLACTLGTIIAGLYTAMLRKFLFENKRPPWIFGIGIGAVVEVTHIALLFITNMSTPHQAFNVVVVCSPPMITGVAVSTCISILVVAAIKKEGVFSLQYMKGVAQSIQMAMFTVFVVAFIATVSFVYVIQNTSTNAEITAAFNDALDIEQQKNSGKTYENRSEFSLIELDGSAVVLGNAVRTGTSDVAELPLDVATNAQPRELFTLTLQGESYFAMYDTLGNRKLIVICPVNDAHFSRDVSVVIIAYLEIIVFAFLFFLIYVFIDQVVIRNIRKLNEKLQKITGGDLEVVFDIRAHEEFSELSDELNSTIQTLKGYIADAESRIDEELGYARDIQAHSLPTAFPKLKEAKLFASMHPAKEVGGDFYDFYFVSDTTLAVLIADVSGKGIPASLFMMKAKTLIQELANTGLDPAEVLTRANARLSEGNDSCMFVTVWLGYIDLNTGHVVFANAGHDKPALRHKDGNFEYVEQKVGLVLAALDMMTYKPQEFWLKPGDTLYLYTDGVPEATNINNELYGLDRLLRVLDAAPSMEVEELCTYIYDDVMAFTGEADQFDDCTMLAVNFWGREDNDEDATEGARKIRRIAVPANPNDPLIGYLHERVVVDAKIESITEVVDFVNSHLEAQGFSSDFAKPIDVAIDEILCNIASYAYEDHNGAAAIDLVIKHSPKSVTLSFIDQGVPFDPLLREDPNTHRSIEELVPGGLGIFIVKQTMDDVRYEYIDGCNVLTLYKAE